MRESLVSFGVFPLICLLEEKINGVIFHVLESLAIRGEQAPRALLLAADESPSTNRKLGSRESFICRVRDVELVQSFFTLVYYVAAGIRHEIVHVVWRGGGEVWHGASRQESASRLSVFGFPLVELPRFTRNAVPRHAVLQKKRAEHHRAVRVARRKEAAAGGLRETLACCGKAVQGIHTESHQEATIKVGLPHVELSGKLMGVLVAGSGKPSHSFQMLSWVR